MRESMRAYASQRSKGPLALVTWRCTRTCNNNCLYCSFGSTPSSYPSLDTEGGKHVVDQIYDFGANYFGISGGEPLLRRDIFEIIGHARSLGMSVSLISNGFFVDGKNFDNLVRNEVHTAISIDGTERSNDLIRGKGAYAKGLSAMSKLSKAGILDCLVATLTNLSYQDVEHIVDLAAEYGARAAVIHNFIPVGRAKEHLVLAPTPEQYEWVWNKLYDLMMKYKGKPEINVYAPMFARVAKEKGMPDFEDWLNKHYLGKCTMDGGYMDIIENGDVKPCGFNEHYKLGNIMKGNLKEFWNDLQSDEFYLRLKDKNNLKGNCGVCEYRDICGGCRTRAEIYTGDLFESDPACGYVPKILREK